MKFKHKRFLKKYQLELSIISLLIFVFSACYFIEYYSEDSFNYSSSTLEDIRLDPNYTIDKNISIIIDKSCIINFSEDEEYYYLETNINWSEVR